MTGKLILIILACALFAVVGAVGEKMLCFGRGKGGNARKDELGGEGNSIRVLIKPVGEAAYLTRIDNTLNELQSIVGGYIEALTIAKDMVIICNEEGRINGSLFNTSICGEQLFGTIIICGVSNEGFADIPVNDETVRHIFCSLFATQR